MVKNIVIIIIIVMIIILNSHFNYYYLSLRSLLLHLILLKHCILSNVTKIRIKYYNLQYNFKYVSLYTYTIKNMI